MITQPQSCCSVGCALVGKGRGFALPTGDPLTAKLAIVLEAPTTEDVGQWLGDSLPGVIDNPREELLRRERLYPELSKQFFVKGTPAIGRSGSILNNWLLPKVGIRRSDVYVTSVLRCCPPRNKQMKPYPTGVDRNGAEMSCRQYDRLREFAPQAIVITMAPHDLIREITPLPLVIRDLEKVVSFVNLGLRTLVLMGGKAAELYLGWGGNVARSRGDYVIVSDRYGDADQWYDRVLARVGGKVKRKTKVKQLAAGMADFASPDVLDVVGPKKRKPMACKAVTILGICGEAKVSHPTPHCEVFVSGRKKKLAA